MKNSTFKKALVCLLICLISFMQKGICTNIPKLAKSKKLIVIIPDEDSKAYNNIMDAVQDHWKFGEYKFMKIKDAEQLYGNSDYLFLALVVQTMQPKTTSGDFNLTLRRGKFFSNKDFNKLAPVYAAPLFNNYGVYYGSMDNMPPLLEKQLYFLTADFITQLKYKNGTPPVSRENGVRYLCKKEELESTKEILSTKKVLLIEKNQQLNNDTLDRKEIIRGYVNNPNLEILYVDYEEIELALKKKEPDMMIAMQSKVISCSDFDDLCFLPMYTQKERSKQKKTTALIITGSMVAMVGLLVGMVAGMSAIMHKI